MYKYKYYAIGHYVLGVVQLAWLCQNLPLYRYQSLASLTPVLRDQATLCLLCATQITHWLDIYESVLKRKLTVATVTVHPL